MPLSKAEEPEEWLRVARRDLALAEAAMSMDPPLTGEALYHAQQTAEKALKGFLVAHRTEYPLTHDVRQLLKLVAPLDAGLVREVAAAAELTDFAVRFRYPGEDPPPPEYATPWIDLARRVCTEVQRRIKGD